MVVLFMAVVLVDRRSVDGSSIDAGSAVFCHVSSWKSWARLEDSSGFTTKTMHAWISPWVSNTDTHTDTHTDLSAT